tara:strand:- start:340 stop:921 length:582 start_codon:yes stop_codon:yes gene_type:complete
MSKSTKKRKKNKRRKKPQHVYKGPGKSRSKETFFSYVWKTFAVFAVVLGVVVTLYPKVSVEPDSYLDPKNPLKTLFRITNEGFLPLYDVRILSAIHEVKSKREKRIIGVTDYKSRLFNPIHVADKISSGESDTAYCALGGLKLPFGVDYIDMAIIVDFAPSFLNFWRMERVFPFTTQKNVSGDVILIHRPVNK